jgi:hypothetical protein
MLVGRAIPGHSAGITKRPSRLLRSVLTQRVGEDTRYCAGATDEETAHG